ncbi:MAG: ribonuclease H-like domain-containing protein [bacterium]|nr:ribonuclease H-like domain-containing protein [bacterium]
MRKIVLDLETKNSFQDIGRRDPAALDLSLVGIYESATDSYQSFLEDELPRLWPILERADLLIGFNIIHFDIPILDKYYHGNLRSLRTLDLLREVEGVLGRRIGLDALAHATLGTNKSAHGMDAIRWWRTGEIEKIRRYCLDDVRITKELYDHALSHGALAFETGGEKRSISLDVSSWEAPAAAAAPMTMTMPW